MRPPGRDRLYVGPRHRWRTAWLAGLLAEALAPRAPAGDQEPVAARVPPVVLDLGCGEGSLALDLAARGIQVLACDRDAARLRRLAGRARDQGQAGRIHLFRADAQALPLASLCLDGAACGEVLEHLADDRGALAALGASLRPGAPVVISVPAGAARLGPLDRAVGHVRRYDRTDLQALLAAAHIPIRDLRPWGFPFGRLYDRWVQSPALSTSSPRARRLWARLGRSAPIDRCFRLLFALDLPLSRLAPASGSGWLVLGHAPGRVRNG
jgi:SAM-dependent methyltransferase